ncbi:MAG: hypothetical protein KKA42_14090 [candidate division Zixibacteria bacterium]|nr:hypothetical protein [candidate division Zixibacteria bacterium]
MAAADGRSGLRLSPHVLNLIGIILGVAAAYFMTIQSLKVELAAKAESVVVESLNRKLTRMEVLLTESVVGRDQFYAFSHDVEARLIRIENHLTGGVGGTHEQTRKP